MDYMQNLIEENDKQTLLSSTGSVKTFLSNSKELSWYLTDSAPDIVSGPTEIGEWKGLEPEAWLVRFFRDLSPEFLYEVFQELR